MEFEQEVEDYLTLKSKHTAEIYASAFRKFLTFYQSKHGKGKGRVHPEWEIKWREQVWQSSG